jgi:hypothetical protein
MSPASLPAPPTFAVPMPRLPVLGWAALTGRRAPPMDTVLSLPRLHYSTSGRASILLALEMLGLGPGDRILLPTYHCPTMVAPADALGVAPLFYPVDEHGTPCLDWLNMQDLSGVRALLVAHFFGLPQPMEVFRRWCDARGIALIEDCAHALFGRSGGRPIGAWGDIAIASLTKFLPVPEGGCLVNNVGAPLLALTPCGAKTSVKAAVDIFEEGARHHRLTGLNTLVAGPLAALRGLRQPAPSAAPARAGGPEASPADGFSVDAALAHRALAAPCRWVAEHLPRERIVGRRRHNYAWLARRLAGLPGVHPLLPELPGGCAPYVFPLWVDAPDPGYAELRRHLPVFRWDRLWPGVPILPGDHGRDWSHHVLQVGCHQDLDEADLEHLATIISALFCATHGQKTNP